MLEERARVLSVGAATVWVEADRSIGCAKCEAGEGCGGGVLGRLVKRGNSRLEVSNEIAGLSPGDEVVIGFDEQALLRTSLMAYLVPLVCLFAAALAAEFLLSAPDIIVAGAGLCGLLAGYFLLRHFGETVSEDARYRPSVLRKASVVNEGCRVYVPKH